MSDYAQHSITITLNFDMLNLPECVNLDDVAELLTDSRWDEGRYPFDEEMLHVGLKHVLDYAVRCMVQKAMDKQHDTRNTIPHRGSHTSPARLKAQEALDGFYVGLIDSIKQAKIAGPVKDG